MSEYHESKGASLKDMRDKKRQENLHHLRVHAHPDGSPESPRWIVAHHSGENSEPSAEHEFDSGHEMLAHIANHASVPEESEEG